MSADDRLRRLLALVPWVAAAEGPRVEEVCRRFGLSEAQLAGDLELLFVCGLHPYTPDLLIDADISEGRVWIRYADYFSRPLRLTPAEGLALVAAGRTLLAVPGADRDGPLARGLAKLARLLGIDDEQALNIDPGEVSSELLVTLRQALAEHRVVELDYYSFGRDSSRSRVVEPQALFSAAGQWYLAAHCRSVGDERLFRVDRVRRAKLLSEHFDPPDVPPALALYHPRPEDPRVELELQPGGRWVVEQYPVESMVELPNRRVRVRLVASERPWLERLLLRLGPDAHVVSGDTQVVADAAARVLARYRSSSGGVGAPRALGPLASKPS